MKKYLTLFLIAWSFFLGNDVIAQTPKVLDLLAEPSAADLSVVTFDPTVDGTHAISGLSLHFLAGVDCYSGYLAHYQTTQADLPFPISANTPFVLSSRGIYQAALESVNSQDIDAIQSVLIRLISNERGRGYDRFLSFGGTCQDQEINCCIPIYCSKKDLRCLSSVGLSSQQVIW